jgi:prephenate dehydratase/prephenate dehydrogenase
MHPLIGIIGGKGKMGQYFAQFFERNGFKVILSDRNTTLTNTQLVKKADVVIVSVPINQTEVIIKKIAPYVKKSGLLMDFTSVKVNPMKAMKAAKASTLGCHPLFGPSNPIQGQLVILCPGKGKKWHTWLQKLLEKNRVTVKNMSANKHDKLMAYVQALTHFSDIALADTFRKSGLPIGELLACQSPVYRFETDMMGRILNQDPKLYAQIQSHNPFNASVMNNFIASCQALLGDEKTFLRTFKANAKYLGDFTERAMTESDQIIKTMLGSNAPSSHHQPGQNEHYDLAILGPKDTHSDQVVKKHCPKASVWYAGSIASVIELVESGRIPVGLIPIENSTVGSVRQSLDELYVSEVWISKMVDMPIRHNIVGIKKTALKSVKTIYSHLQALLQCRRFLEKHCPQATLIPVGSTAAGITRVIRENNPHHVAIASPSAAKQHKLVALRSEVQDNKGNKTTFAFITPRAKAPSISPQAKHAFIAFHFKKDSSGSLSDILNDFADASINLTKIESRPNPNIASKYVFYIEFQGNLGDPHVQNTLGHVGQRVEGAKVLGCY